MFRFPRHRTACHILARFPELAVRYIKPFHAVRVVKGQADLHQFVLDENAGDVPLHTPRREAAHGGIQIRPSFDHALVDLHVVEQTQPHTRAVHRLDVLVDNGLYQFRFTGIDRKRIEVIRSRLYLAYHFAGRFVL